MSDDVVWDPLDADIVALYRNLRDADRRRQGLFVVEGRLLVERLLTASRFAVHSVLLTPAIAKALAPVVDAARVPMMILDGAVMRQIAGFDFHRGALAIGKRGEPTPLQILISPPVRTLVVLERLADPENVGAVMRNAQAFGADGVVLAPGTADPLGRKAIRVSAGAALALPFAHADAWPDDLHRLRAAGFMLVALTPDPAARDLGTLTIDPRARVALLVGSEGDGLSAAARAAAEVEVRIPIARDVDSLNVAVAAGIALHRLRG
jgi:tRNA G18 (ribose-2'-O)-methylase SpoU